ncbi:hypothetical protein DFQ14_10692 [Halopolyspora algeriensis]|uniref:Uncharacterized protein n=1 Tax=Halopolyspora algeriensis TaxID=1500506 RepID=A0A368VQ35_9ACTN|nr:ATP-binding protein [Halopolyspora algeriensis]RCW43614.1 hypothetical protein DFQ14_10692 [Halopolyspora algeriensis]TQM47601.1 hypothetical protein FHU43_3597 [Halopolyspora algeriensis]
MSGSDPFGTAELRRAVLRAWEGSPTRFREDANAEEDLRLGGYRDRLLVELAQNAADAAGAGGVLRVELAEGQPVGGGPAVRELRVANTGTPLTAAGVTGLASLRASAKREGASVGRFGVGFAAVLAVSDEPRVVSTGGGVAFSAQHTREEVAHLTGPAEELAARGGAVPVLRLVWPQAGEPPHGFATEVRLPLRSDIDADALLESCAQQAPDLLLALPALAEIRVGARSWRREDLGADRVVVHGPQRSDRWLLHHRSGRLPEAALSDLGAEARQHTEWRVCWALPLDEEGEPAPLERDVLHTPTPTEERLSLPARLLAGVPMEPDRRRVSASSATDAVLMFAAECYPELIDKVTPQDRPVLVPLPEFPLSDVDDSLRRAVLDRLRSTSWLPAADGGTVTPNRAGVLDRESPELVALLADVVPGLLVSELSGARHRRALAALEVRRLGMAELVEAVTGLQRPASWWRRLYEALDPIERADRSVREELEALPVPLADGRTVIGVRDVLLGDGEGGPDPVATLSTLDIAGLRIADREAAHPLLERLGAHRADPGELLDTRPLVDAVRNSVSDAQAGTDTRPLAEAVLRLVEHTGARDWIGALALPDADGGRRRADELLLPGAALLDVLDPEAVGEDAALGVLDADFAAQWPPEVLRSVGVLDGFAVHVEDDPVRPEETLADVEQWWAEQEAAAPGQWPPARFVGVRDLDLVSDEAWPAAIRLLTADPDTLEALREPGGYSTWWIERFAMLAGHPPRHWRLPGAEGLAGLYEVAPEVGLSEEQLRLAGVRAELRVTGAADAADLMRRLGDRERSVRAGTALRAHRALADAVACELVDPAEAEPPQAVRSVSGAVVGAERAVVLDEPWLLGVFEAPLVVAGGSPEEFDAEALAELFDLPLASEQGPMRVREGAGAVQRWRDVGRVPAACELLGMPVPDGDVTLQDGLRVVMAGEEHPVHWWVDESGAVRAERTPDGLGRALAWAAGRWSERFALTALLADPQATTLLR